MQFASRLVSTRRGTLFAALLIALLAGASILTYLNSYRDSLKASGSLVTVLVAKRAIPKGTSGSVVAAKDLYTVTTIRESQLLEGAMSDPATLRSKVATREIFEGAQLTALDFGAVGDSLAAQLTDRQRIVSVPLDSAHGLISAIQPGNRVDVYAGFNVTPLGANGVPIEGGQARPILRLILSNVPVLAVGGKASGSGTTNVSLKVDDRKAAQVAFASDNGKLWLALRPSAGAKASRPDIVTIETLLLGVPSVQMLHSLGGRR
jgi:Flp pilus assembly protein CpaB